MKVKNILGLRDKLNDLQNEKVVSEPDNYSINIRFDAFEETFNILDENGREIILNVKEADNLRKYLNKIL